MNRFKSRGVDLVITAVALSVFTASPAWATAALPGPAVGFLAGGAIIGSLVIAKWWRGR